MTRNFLEAIEESPELDDIDRQAVSEIYNTVYGNDTEDATLVDMATSEPPSLAEFENLDHDRDDVEITEQGLKMTQTLPDGTDVTTVK